VPRSIKGIQLDCRKICHGKHSPLWVKSGHWRVAAISTAARVIDFERFAEAGCTALGFRE
jgi:hypothetical protein